MNVALIVAGGIGKRMGLDIPKQFVLVNGKPLLIYTIEAFAKHRDIDDIVLVVPKDYKDEVIGYISKYSLPKVSSVVIGGETRQQSVKNGLDEIKRKGIQDDDIVLIHDAARPLLSEDIITENVRLARSYGAVMTALPSVDTVVRGNESVGEFLNRNEIYLEQTPASFMFKVIYEAHEKAKGNDASDDCLLVKQNGKEIQIVRGNRNNFKITTKEDLELFIDYISFF